MNKILAEVEKRMLEALKTNLTDVGMGDLEKDGTIFYMNGQNGTDIIRVAPDKFEVDGPGKQMLIETRE